jgi:CHAT domain-containing protein
LEESPNSEEHIGTAEMAKMLEEARRQAENPEHAAEMHPHLSACSTCREQFEGSASLDRQLISMRPSEAASRRADCPALEVWREIAGGVTAADETLVHIEHASRCDHCGPLLRTAMTEFTELNGQLSEAERIYISALDSANVEWQQGLARRIAKNVRAQSHFEAERESVPLWRVKWMSVPRLAIAGAALIAVVAGGSWFTIQRHQPAAAERLLASAYSERRTLELRIAGADYAPLRVSRGPEASFTSRPPALLKAEALIAAQLVSHPADPSWLQAQAQADVLEGKYDAAVEALHRALELEPNSPALLIDLATAYSQRAQQENRPDDFSDAYEYLSRALTKRPDDPVALFNRALVGEHLSLYHQALEDWERYLKVDPSSQWADEARSHANAVREKLKAHESGAKLLLSPAQVAAAATDLSIATEVDQRIEEYLSEAVRNWLPQGFPEAGSTANPDAARALFFLAELTSKQHGDRWLTDLLRGSSAPRFPQAVAALARANQANGTDEYEASRQQAALAEHLFRSSGNTAGVLRSEFEQAFEAQMSRRGEECRLRSIAGEAESKLHSYTWLQIQMGLEESVCSALGGDNGTFEKASRRAQDRAQQANYGALYLRALGFVAESKFTMGDRASDWKFVSSGLERYWSGQFPAMRGYNLYVEEGFATEADQTNLRLAVWREAAGVIDPGESLMLRAEVHKAMATAASAARQPEVAERQFEEAARLYALAPQTAAIRVNRLWSEIRMAQMETGQSAFDAALARLTRVQDEVGQLSDDFLTQAFYSTLGEIRLRSHHIAEAGQAFRPALRLAEQNLASLTPENRTSWSKNAAPVYLGLAEADLVQGREQESLDVFEWYLGAPQRAGMRELGAGEFLPDPSRLSARFPLLSNQTVVAFGVLPDGLAIWVYDDRGVSVKWIPKSAAELQELQDLAANFYGECSDPNSELSALRENARRLYTLLIAPVELQLAPGRTLAIETDGWLARLPFEALLDSNNHYLIERAPIVHSLGQDSEAALHGGIALSADAPAVVVGSTASSAADGLIPIPDLALEVDAVAGSFHSAHVLKGGDATLGAVRNVLPGVAVFHFVGHSLAVPRRTGLLLESEDGQTNIPQLMDANAVRRIPLQSLQLAVLSACSTASGSGGASGFDSITDAFLRAGVPHVVASRWAVDSAETTGFVTDFYRNALAGQTVSEAIRLASRKMLANPRTSRPYYWSMFAAYGRP